MTVNALGLDTKKTEELAGQLNQLLANFQIYYQNLRGIHWNIRGKNFFGLHVKFEELYTDANMKVDLIAERVLTLGETPLHTFDDYIKSAKVPVGHNVSVDVDAVALAVPAGLDGRSRHENYSAAVDYVLNDPAVLDLGTAFTDAKALSRNLAIRSNTAARLQEEALDKWASSGEGSKLVPAIFGDGPGDATLAATFVPVPLQQGTLARYEYPVRDLANLGAATIRNARRTTWGRIWITTSRRRAEPLCMQSVERCLRRSGHQRNSHAAILEYVFAINPTVHLICGHLCIAF